MSERWKKEKWKKKAKINHSILVFLPTIYLAPLMVYTKFEDSGSPRSRDFCDGNVYWRERKWTNKWNDKQEEADSFLHNAYPTFVPSFKILSAVVLEKSLTKKKMFTHTHTDKQTHTITEKTKLYTPYILRIPGV